jgi:hypothetical protein
MCAEPLIDGTYRNVKWVIDELAIAVFSISSSHVARELGLNICSKDRSLVSNVTGNRHQMGRSMHSILEDKAC